MGFLFALQFLVPVAVGAYLVWRFVLTPFFERRLAQEDRDATSQKIREKLEVADRARPATAQADLSDQEIDQAIEELNENN